MQFNILIVDDDNLVGMSLKRVLQKMGYEVDVCMDGGKVFEKVDDFKPDVILLDIYLTDYNGLEILKSLQKEHFHIPVIMITAYSDVKIAVTAMKSGAFDFLLKPIDLDQLQLVLNKSLDHLKLRSEVDRLHSLMHEDEIPKEFFGKNRSMVRVVNYVEKLAKTGDTTILIEGESGTGKELFAKFIHQHSLRKDQAFITINCAAIPKELAESELFGHERGAFTGAAQKTKLGKFELANGGTILLDEIGELSLDLQVKLLRVLQERNFYRLGGEKEISVDVRVITATNRNLEEEVAKGNFREDLYYRLNVAKVTVPPLRERKDDIAPMAYSFMQEFSVKFNKQIKGIPKEALTLLENQYWKGNIRELRNTIERAMLMVEGDELREQYFGFLTNNKGQDTDEDQFVLKIPKKGVKIDHVLKTLILKTLEITKGNQVKAAKILGLTRSKLRYRMEQLKIEVTKKIE